MSDPDIDDEDDDDYDEVEEITTSDDIADGVVLIFNAIDDKLIEFTAVNPPEIVEITTEGLDGWVVYVTPFAEGEESIDRGDGCKEELQVDVYVHGPIGNQVDRAKAIKFLKQLRRSLRNKSIDGYLWSLSETVNGIFDEDVLKTKQQFLSLFRATFYSFE